MARSTRAPWAGLATLLLVAACGGAPATPTPAPATPTPGPVESVAPSTAASPTGSATGPANLEADAAVEAGASFEVGWTGPNAKGDYVTIVAAGATKWTNEPYFYTNTGTPGKLTAPSQDGAYELWYVSGTDSSVLFRRPITVTPFQGALLGPETVVANTRFEVAWNGPDGPGDYVTIVKAGATRWTNEDYFYTNTGSPGTLTAPLEAGAYELWYVIGSDSTIQSRRPITVTAAAVTLQAPQEVARGADFQVAWTGPNGPGDYVTIVKAGAAPGEYLSYFYTSTGAAGTLTAPDEPGAYEIRYLPGAADVVLATIPITVK